MGGENSKYNRIGGIHIDLDQVIVKAGDTIKGMIHISLRSEIQACSLIFKFTGKSRATLKKSKSKSKSSVEAEESSSKTICDIYHTLLHWSSPLAAGDYSIPFSYEIPKGVPGSFEGSVKDLFLHTFYTITAKLESKSEVLRQKNSVIISEGPRIHESPFALEKSAGIKSCCCVNKGDSLIKLSLPQNTYEVNQKIDLTVEIDNSHGKTSVKNLEAKIYLLLRYFPPIGEKIVATRTINTVTQKVHVKPGDSLFGDQAVKMQLNLNSIENDVNNMYSMFAGQIQCAYFIEVVGDVSGIFLCCGQIPAVKLPVTVIPNSRTGNMKIAPPPGWNPKMFIPVNMKYDKKFDRIFLKNDRNSELDVTSSNFVFSSPSILAEQKPMIEN
ncbi:hypothetical protein SteCoe_31627 [Stentor coeruleus]|uniref:Arrestin C-terminal-like domain-containing protein n=1 Tax=Stentor coeruleus TaxID=5963 RepID=A0A1R2B0T0_9CILI|nr:hypothetical protein SteCoe_31627 [Stentor coeruleus]